MTRTTKEQRALNALQRAETVLANMARENEGAIFNRWPIHHEPLRSDARGILPIVQATILALLDEIEGAEKGDVAIDPTAADKAWAVFLYPADISWGTRQARITFEEALLTYLRTAGECSGGADRVPVAADANATPAPLYAAPVPAKVTEEMVEDGLRAWLGLMPSAPVAGHSQLPRMRAALQAALSHKGGGNGE